MSLRPATKRAIRSPAARLPKPATSSGSSSSDLFEPEIIHDGLELTGDWEKLGKLPLVEYFCRRGWVNLAWRKP